MKLGGSEKEILVSANALRHLEYDRLRVAPVVQSSLAAPPIDEDDADATVDGQLLSHLVGEVSEVSLDETVDRSVYDLHVTGRKSKNSNSKKAARTGSKNAKFSR